jgi:hypothetical protein
MFSVSEEEKYPLIRKNIKKSLSISIQLFLPGCGVLVLSMRMNINDDPHPLIQERGPNDRRSVGTPILTNELMQHESYRPKLHIDVLPLLTIPVQNLKAVLHLR